MTGEFKPWAELVIRLADSYCEVSPSQRGVKLLVKGEKPKGKSAVHKRGFELHANSSHFCITGQRQDGTPAEINERRK